MKKIKFIEDKTYLRYKEGKFNKHAIKYFKFEVDELEQKTVIMEAIESNFKVYQYSNNGVRYGEEEVYYWSDTLNDNPEMFSLLVKDIKISDEVLKVLKTLEVDTYCKLQYSDFRDVEAIQAYNQEILERYENKKVEVILDEYNVYRGTIKKEEFAGKGEQYALKLPNKRNAWALLDNIDIKEIHILKTFKDEPRHKIIEENAIQKYDFKVEEDEKIKKIEKIEKVEKDEKIEEIEKLEKVEELEKVEKIEKVEELEEIEKIEEIEEDEKIEDCISDDRYTQLENELRAELLKLTELAPTEASYITMEQLELTMEKLVQLRKLKGIHIYTIGRYIWVSGNTYPVKEELKELGFLYRGKKWNWTAGERVISYKKMDEEKLKSKYGALNII